MNFYYATMTLSDGRTLHIKHKSDSLSGAQHTLENWYRCYGIEKLSVSLAPIKGISYEIASQN